MPVLLQQPRTLFVYRAGDPLVPGATFARASAATYRDAAGVLQTAASGVLRDGHHALNPATGLYERAVLLEGQRTNLLLNSAAPATQSVGVTAQAYTLSFYGTGTVTLSGASTAGPLVGTGAGARVTLTFTPSAGTLTLTVAGTVTNANLEAGAFASSHIPTAGAAATRAADALSFPFGAVPQAMTAFVRFVEAGAILSSGTVGLLTNATSAQAPRFAFWRGGGGYRWQHVNAVGVTSVAPSSPALGDLVELRGVVNTNGSTLIGQAVSGAAEGTGSNATPEAMAPAWATGALHPGSFGGAGQGPAAFTHIAFFQGTRTLAECRAHLGL